MADVTWQRMAAIHDALAARYDAEGRTEAAQLQRDLGANVRERHAGEPEPAYVAAPDFYEPQRAEQTALDWSSTS